MNYPGRSPIAERVFGAADYSAALAMTVLAIETSCDETAVAILRGDELLASEIASQIDEHREFGGVVPEVASRNHLVHLPRLLQLACQTARVQLAEVDAFAATSGPGLASSLLVGNSAAKGLALGSGKPFLAINHLEGHLLSPFFPAETPFRPSRQMGVSAAAEKSRQMGRMVAGNGANRAVQPHVALIVSGGHTLLVHVRAVGGYAILGRTVDDAAGEAFDKVAKLLELGYPGGPAIESRAREGNSSRFALPRGMLSSGDLNFSFSGLKTAVRYLLPKLERDSVIHGKQERLRGILEEPRLSSLEAGRDDTNDVCASFQQAVIDVLCAKSLSAVRQTRSRLLTMSGGVSCNRALRQALEEACAREGIQFLAAAPGLCTDNAAMIAFAALLRLRGGKRSLPEAEIDPNLPLA